MFDDHIVDDVHANNIYMFVSCKHHYSTIGISHKNDDYNFVVSEEAEDIL